MTATDTQTVSDRQPTEPPANLTDTATVSDRHTPEGAARVSDPETVTDSQGAWLSTRDAQQALGISERTLYRRLARAQYERRVRADGQTEVWVATAQPLVTDAGPSRDSHAEQIERGLVLVDRFSQAVAQQTAPLLQELAATRQQLVDLAQENGRLSARVVELEQRLSVTVTVSVSDGQAAATPPRPWWARLLAWRRAIP